MPRQITFSSTVNVPHGLPNPDAQRHLRTFRDAVDRLDEPDGLFHAALLISAIEFPDMADGWWEMWHRRLDEFAAAAGTQVKPEGGKVSRSALENLARHFNVDLGFAGNTDDYQAPENSCLTHVMTSRQGLPITLSILLAAIGQRLGLALFGVGAPGHFLTGVRLGNESLFLDPFHGPEVMDASRAATLIGRILTVPAEHILPFLVPSPPREILTRMLNNLKVAYMNREQFDKLRVVLDWLLALDPDNAMELRNRGLLLLREGDFKQGAADLLKYLQTSPDGEELELIRREATLAKKRRDGDNFPPTSTDEEDLPF